MAKSSSQKLKLLYLMKLLQDNTDEQHVLTLQQLITGLNAYGISAERKSLYDDIDTLRQFGLDICTVKSRTTGYYVANRTFELPELKLLVDSVQASKFITEKKSLALIKKLESLSSIYEARLIRRQVYVHNRIKSMNESIYYNVDKIHNGIAQNRKITFKYFEYTIDKERAFRRDGKRYCVSPFALTWDNENYYMVGFDGEAGKCKHYRVDKMELIALLDEARDGMEQYKTLDMAAYAKRNFSMYGGAEQRVSILFANRLVGVVIDRFGKDIPIVKVDQAHFRVAVTVAVSPQFYAWVFGLGAEARILGPENVVNGMKEQVGTVARMY